MEPFCDHGPPPMSSPVTLHDLAERVGVHRSTVALALRDSSRISEAVRARVKSTAAEMGYRANPLLMALMQTRRVRRKVQSVVLAYVTCHPSRYGWRPPAHDRPNYFPGAVRRAEELGYRVEHFWYCEDGMTPKRFAEILLTRNITGLLVGRLPPGRHTLEMPWDQFSAVALGMTLQDPILNRVAEDAFASACKMIDECSAKGFRRIGLVFSEADDSPAVGYRYMSAYLGHQAFQSDKIPPLEYHGPETFEADFREWFRLHRPEAIIATHAAPVARALDCMGIGRGTLPVFALINDKPEQGFAGMHLDAAVLGTLAVEMLVGMLYRGEKGLPSYPHQVLVQSKWVEPQPAVSISG